MKEVKECKAPTRSKVRYRLLCLLVVISLLVLVIRASDTSFVFNAENTRPEQPNIVLILADDLGWSDIAPYGGEVQTPNLHLLAMQGLRFTQFHNTSKCGPSRASLLTGLYAQQVGMSTTAEAYLENSVTLAEVLKSAGYRTLMVGKYHGLDNPYDRGFDRYFGLRDGAKNHFNPGHQRLGEAAPAQKNRVDDIGVSTVNACNLTRHWLQTFTVLTHTQIKHSSIWLSTRMSVNLFSFMYPIKRRMIPCKRGLKT